MSIHESEWAADNRRARQRAWRLANREKVRSDNALHLSTQRGITHGVAVNDLSLFDWEELLNQWDRMCAYCGERGDLELEHKTPFTRGGDNTKSNVVPACRSCNRHKYNKTAAEFVAAR
jgi:5-methylcytosine-specific restriction endonuclease McrA